MGLENTIARDKNSPSQDRAKAMIFLCHHIDEALKMQYVTLESPLELSERLKERYDHLRLTLLPRLRHCGENVSESDMMEKTFSIFHASNMVLQQQYRERGFQKHFELITCLLLAEQNNELLLINHESQPTGANPFPEANAIQPEIPVHGRGQLVTWLNCIGPQKKDREEFPPETNHVAHDDTFDDVMNENITHLDADDLLHIADDVK
ncbi:uncharacterized protein LOC127255164 [Andrographis paniculata]|uniref:uncharacterized protein LOC127255164 n=1 Tax=Andrographis paniculata TaxID=175694 RepID=UPI0021E908C5|nr:uncharacterized protein LOC127255164 [Andrographis paniculata]